MRLFNGTVLLILLYNVDMSISQNTTFKVGVLLMTNSSFPIDLPRVGPAIDMGVEEVYNRYGIRFEIIMRNYSIWCFRARYQAPGNMADMYYKSNVRAFVGPACSYAVETAGRMAEYLKVPLVTGLGDLVHRNPTEKDMFETTVILSYNSKKLSVSVRALLKEYNWRHVSIIYDNDEVFYHTAGPSMMEDIDKDPDFPYPHAVPFNRNRGWNPEATLRDASHHARVFIVLVNANEFRLLMYHASRLGMASGQYVFITIQLAEVAWWGSYRNFLQGDYMDEALKESYECALILSLLNPAANNTAFTDELKMRASRDYNYEFGPDEPVHYFLTSFYEAVLYLGAAYNRSLAVNGNINDGYEIARTFFGSSFPGLNKLVAVEDSGTRIADFEVLDLIDAEKQLFQRVAIFLGSTLKYESVAEVRWPNGVPEDKPTCGFQGELCVVEKLSTLAIGVIIGACLVVSLMVVIIAQMLYSRRRANMDMRWRASWRDVDVFKMSGSMQSGFSKSKLTLDVESELREDTGQFRGMIGNYQGAVVFIRRYNIKSIDMSQRHIREMRQMYNLRHSNLETFIGACVEPGNIAVLSEVCPRGSLMDIIANDGIDLDWTFRNSLINDIVQGMRYLHESDVKIHGRLNSSNCVVDSRFMLKIKGFGPKCFIEMKYKAASNVTMNYSKLLWTAPEELGKIGWSAGTQKSDVYSFAIILHEIINRSEPYDSFSQTAEEIVEKVKNAEHPPFRPEVVSGECPRGLLTVMQEAWGEQPENRPTFDAISVSLKKELKSTGSNIMDNLMRRMEQYANNLESLVEDRTKAYMDEKKRAEDLLYKMLPISVAKQLQSGNQVQPETFDGVTIYFSDIVGFTSLAGRSTPMQVVDLLNDLYTLFDGTIDEFQVYKVETIGDAYMCASGLPIRIGDRHVQEISNMALSILRKVNVFSIRHLPQESLRIRIGLHSGGVVAGVVGLTMPRYCLFGDTVNTASRMESTGEAMKIHVSESTQELLEKSGHYRTQLRGETQVKGKGLLKTYWLLEKRSDSIDINYISKTGAYNDSLTQDDVPCFNTKKTVKTQLLDHGLDNSSREPPCGAEGNAGINGITVPENSRNGEDKNTSHVGISAVSPVYLQLPANELPEKHIFDYESSLTKVDTQS